MRLPRSCRFRRSSVAAGALIIALPALLCGGESGGEERDNLLIICIDTLRKDRLGCYGHSRDTSPSIDAQAGEGMRFDAAYANAPWTLPSVCSLLSGLPPDVHRAVDFLTPISDEAELLPQVLHSAGYQTAAIVGNRFFDPLFGLERGFDDLDQECLADRTEINSEGISDRAIEWLKTQARAGFFLYLHYFDPHYNYFEHPGFEFGGEDTERVYSGADIFELRKALPAMSPAELDRLRSLYDSEVAFTDHHVGRVLETLERSSHGERTLVVILADHGEELGEHGWIGHTLPLYQETVAIPLLIAGKGIRKGTCGDLVQLHDLKDLLLHVLQIRQAPAGSRAAALSAVLQGPSAPNAGSSRAMISVETTSQPPRKKKMIEQAPWRLFVDEAQSGVESYRLFKLDEPPGPGRRQRDPKDHPDIVQQLLREREAEYKEKLLHNQAAVARRRALIEDGFKLIVHQDRASIELYSLADDPLENDDLALKESARAASMRGVLEAWTEELRSKELRGRVVQKEMIDTYRQLLLQIGYLRDSAVEGKEAWRILLANDDREVRLRLFQWDEGSREVSEAQPADHEELSAWLKEECENHCRVRGARMKQGERFAVWIAWPFKLVVLESGTDDSVALYHLVLNPAETEDRSVEKVTLTRTLRAQLDAALEKPASSSPSRFVIPDEAASPVDR